MNRKRLYIVVNDNIPTEPRPVFENMLDCLCFIVSCVEEKSKDDDVCYSDFLILPYNVDF
jgi:hypothetical protein